MHIVKSKPEIPQRVLDELRKSAIAHKESRGLGEPAQIFNVWMKEAASFYGLEGEYWNTLIDCLDRDYPDWRGYRPQSSSIKRSFLRFESRRLAVIEAVSVSPRSKAGIVDLTGIPESTVAWCVQRLEADQIIEKVPGSYPYEYVLSKSGEAIAS